MRTAWLDVEVVGGKVLGEDPVSPDVLGTIDWAV